MSDAPPSPSHPSALTAGQSAVRVVIELGALAGWGIAGWRLGGGSSLAWPLAIGLPMAAAATWGLFRVPGDLSASGEAVVPVSGKVRLGAEMGVLLGSAVLVGATWRPTAGAGLALLTAVHYSTTPNRTAWLWTSA